MIQRIISVWIAIGAATVVAIVCYALAGQVGRPLAAQSEMELAVISKVFYPDAWLLYLYPLPLGILALLHTFLRPRNCEQSLLLITAALSITAVFIAAFALGMILPYIPGTPSVMR